MGGWISSNFGNGSSESRDNKHEIHPYEQEFNPDTELLTDTLVRSIRWYHWVLYDMRARILYATLLGCFFGIGIPLIVYYVVLDKTEVKNYGSCLIKSEFRFQCLINQQIPPTEDECIEAMCCWEENDELQFNCFHYFTPAYQYSVDSITEQAENSPRVHMFLSPKYSSPTAPLVEFSATIEQASEDHISIEFSDLSSYEVSKSKSQQKNKMTNLDFQGKLSISNAKVDEYFYIQIGRRDTNETIFDTRIGPIKRASDEFSFSTVIPTKWFFGMKGGQGDSGPVTHTFVNGYRSMELPFYLAFENSGASHGVLIETVSPFVVQYIEAPGFMFHFQGIDEPGSNSVKLHIFPGPTPAEVYRQLHVYLNQDIGDTTSFSTVMPPYWALGVHFCRHSTNDTDAYENIRQLERIELVDQEPIPYDTDCISDNLRTPFTLDQDNFPIDSETFSSILEHLNTKHRRIFLAQSVQLPFELYENKTEIAIKNSTNNGPFIGFDEEFNEILYPDFFYTKSQEWIEKEMMDLAMLNASGFALVENYPRTANVSMLCSASEGTMLEHRFSNEPDTSITGSGLICPLQALHENGISHFNLHNVYGDESIKQIVKAFLNSFTQPDERTLFTSSSIWTKSFQNGGYNGPSVPFSWTGYTESLGNLLKNFMIISPFSGTPICGSYVEEQSTDQNDDDLCLRWFQLGLLLPFARNSYGKEQIRGPLDFNLKYQDYLVGNIRWRYKLSPYYYTKYYERLFVETEPLIRPLAYEFYGPEDFQNTSKILNQFMIGQALMAVPPMDPTSSRPAYFPAGVWYDIHGNLLPSDPNKGVTLNIPNTLSEIPLFVRSGFIIPMLMDSIHPSSLMESRKIESYKLLVTFPAPGSNSTGTLFVDDGISLNTVATNNYDYLEFIATETEISITADCRIPLENHLEFSSIIEEIEIVGFPNPFGVKEIISSNSSIKPTVQSISDDETQILLLKDINYNWCELPFLSLSWVLVN